MTTSWNTVATTFAKSDKPYGGGSFRIKGNDVISLKLADPEVTFKPASELKDPQVAEPTEPWMNDTAELLNRGTVRFLRGSPTGDLVSTFDQRGQSAAWWYSQDWRTVYLSTSWMDYKAPVPKNGFAPQATKLWRSTDGGKTWTQLAWPDDQNIGRLLFVDPQRGYAIGWGPRVWRTLDGGQSWQAIGLPPGAEDLAQPRKTFDAAHMGPDGMLRVAYYVAKSGDIRASSVIYRLAPEQSAFVVDRVLAQQTVVDLQSDVSTSNNAYRLYALSRVGTPRDWNDHDDNGRRTGAVSSWWSAGHPDNPGPAGQLHTFDEHLTLDGLSVGRHGVMLVYATDVSGAGAPRDITLLSQDAGKSWRALNDGAAQGGYFDPQTDTQYSLSAYTLRKRVFSAAQ